MRRYLCTTVLVLGCVVGATTAPVHAQSECGIVAAAVGAPEIQRAGHWQPIALGAPIFVGDRLRTGGDDRVKIVFRDDSVLDVAPSTEVVVDTETFDPSAHRLHTLLRVTGGKIRAWVSEYYHEPRARYEVETPTAIAGVRGTEFIAVYDSSTEITDVVGLEDVVEVVGKLGVIGNTVQVRPNYVTQVYRGRFPTAPEPVDPAHLQRYLEGFEIIGTGRRDGLDVLHPAIAGHLVTPQDVPAAIVAARTSGAGAPLEIGSPLAPLADRLLPDVYVNTQPLPYYDRTPPGQVPTGGVHVGF